MTSQSALLKAREALQDLRARFHAACLAGGSDAWAADAACKNADAAIADLDRAIAEDGWLPIETAPKDRTRILIPTKFKVEIAQWNAEAYHRNPRPYWCWDWGRVGDQRENQPRLWRPLPPLPIATENASQEVGK